MSLPRTYQVLLYKVTKGNTPSSSPPRIIFVGDQPKPTIQVKA